MNYIDFLKNPIQTVGDTLGWLPKFGLNFIMFNNIFRNEFREMLFKVFTNPSYENAQALFRYCLQKSRLNIRHPSLPWGFIPNGIFSTDRFERAIRRNLEKNDLHNNFKALYKKTGSN
jgi:hypothetical protein